MSVLCSRLGALSTKTCRSSSIRAKLLKTFFVVNLSGMRGTYVVSSVFSTGFIFLFFTISFLCFFFSFSLYQFLCKCHTIRIWCKLLACKKAVMSRKQTWYWLFQVLPIALLYQMTSFHDLALLSTASTVWNYLQKSQSMPTIPINCFHKLFESSSDIMCLKVNYHPLIHSLEQRKLFSAFTLSESF